MGRRCTVLIQWGIPFVILFAGGEIFRKGFDEGHFYEVGDSIIKAANSKEVTVKNKDSVVVFTMSCDD